MGKTVKYKEFDRLSRLVRRAEWVKKRSSNVRPSSVAYDLGELSALEWAIPILEAYLIKKYTARLDFETLKAFKHEIPDHLYKQIMEERQ